MANLRSSKGSECSHPRVPPTIEVFDPDGDMLLLVGKQICAGTCSNSAQNKQPNAICFQVNSAIIAGASAAFGFVLYSPSAANATGNRVEWTVRLPDDDPQAMHTIINILYGHYPVTLSDEHVNLEQLFNLTMIADKYDLVHHFSDWTVQWVQDMETYWVGRKFVGKSTEDLESLLWIFWVLGHEPLYTYMILQIAFHSELDASGKLTDPTEQLCFTNEFRDFPVPPYAPSKRTAVALRFPLNMWKTNLLTPSLVSRDRPHAHRGLEDDPQTHQNDTRGTSPRQAEEQLAPLQTDRRRRR